MRGLYAFRRNKALAACADQILAVRLTQRFTHKIEILRAAELQQCALHGLFFRRTRNVDRLSGARVKARIEHAGGQRARRGIEILHLFGLVVDVAQIFGQLDGSGKVAARMAGNQIGNEVLFLAEFLRCDFELAADVILTQLAEKRVGFVGHDVVITQTGAHKHFFNLGQGAHLAKQLDVIRVIDDHIRAGLGEQALAACARADFELLITGGAAEIGRGAAHIMDVTFEIRHLRDGLRFIDHGFMAARGDNAALQERDGAEGTRAEAAARVRNGKLHFFNTNDLALRGKAAYPARFARHSCRRGVG